MKKIFKKILKPIIQIENEEIDFKVGFWKGIWVIILWQLLAMLFSTVGSVVIGINYIENHYIYMIFFDIASLPIISIILLNTFGKLTWHKNTFKKFHKKDLIYLALSIVVFRLLFDAFIYPILMLIPTNELLKSAEDMINNNPIYFIISACVFAPILEEVVCRGIVLGGLLNKYSPTISIILSALFFAVAHMNIHQGVNAFILGVLFGYIYYKTRSIYLTMFCHFINNSFAMIAFVPTSVIGIIINIIISVAISVPLIILIRKKLHLGYESNFISTLPDKKIYVYTDLS